jgi:hypothetical protein
MRPWQHARASAARGGRAWSDDLPIHFGETFGRMDERLPDEPAPLQFIPSDVAFEDRWRY